MSKTTITLGVEILGDTREIDVTIAYSYLGAIRGSRDSLCGIRGAGPPLEPDEPAHCEIESVTVDDGGKPRDISWLLDDDQMEAIEKECFEHYQGMADAAAEDRADARRDTDGY